jgi:hypothetical protein
MASSKRLNMHMFSQCDLRHVAICAVRFVILLFLSVRAFNFAHCASIFIDISQPRLVVTWPVRALNS